MGGLVALTSFLDLRPARDIIPPADLFGIVVAFVLCLVLAWGVLVSFWKLQEAGVLGEVMRSTLRITAMVFVILIGAGLFSLVFRGLGGDRMVEEFLLALPGGTVGALLFVMTVVFVLGFFLDFIEIIYVVVPIVAPPLILMGLDPIWLGIMFAVNLQTSFLTPPFGFALFYLRGVAPPSVTTLDIYRGIVPFVGIQILALVILALWPGLALWLPGLIYR